MDPIQEFVDNNRRQGALLRVRRMRQQVTQRAYVKPEKEGDKPAHWAHTPCGEREFVEIRYRTNKGIVGPIPRGVRLIHDI